MWAWENDIPFMDIYSEINETYKKRSKRMYNGKFFLYVIILLFVAMPLIFRRAMTKYEYVENIMDLPEPIQGEATGEIIKNVRWVPITIEFLASYDISARVINTWDYIEFDIGNSLWVRDFALWWWKFSDPTNIDKLDWYENSIRAGWFSIPRENINWFNETFPWELLDERNNVWNTNSSLPFSHNHPIASSRKIEQLLRRVKKWDVVRIKWYLVYAHRNEKWVQHSWWPSSLVRSDTWDWACEIIYVTDIKRLKQKK